MIKLYYNKYFLGILQFEDGFYIFNSNKDEELKAKNDSLALCEYSLFNSENKKSKTLFYEFKRILMVCKRDDIIETSGIRSNDSDFVKLEKLSKLKFNPQGFYITN